MEGRDELLHLLSLIGPSGREHDVSAAMRQYAQRLPGVQWQTAPSGNVFAEVWTGPISAFTEAAPVILSAHLDEIGFTVCDVDDDGMVRILPIGAWNPSVLLGQRAVLCGDGRMNRWGRVHGVIGCAPGHFCREKDRLTFDDLWIDIGARSRADAACVSVGDYGVVDIEPTIIGNMVTGRALDNRVGCYVVLKVLERLALAGEPLRHPVGAVFTTREEIGSHGAEEVMHSPIAPWASACVVVDSTFATDDGTNWLPRQRREYGHTRLGDGPVVHTSFGLSRKVETRLERAATMLHQTQVIYETSQTDADVFNRVVPTACLSIPLRNMHSPVEMASLSDIDAAIDLLTTFVRSS